MNSVRVLRIGPHTSKTNFSGSTPSGLGDLNETGKNAQEKVLASRVMFSQFSPIGLGLIFENVA